MQFEKIGTIRTPFTDPRNMPIQPSGAAGVKGTIEILAEYAGGLKDLDGFSHIILLYQFHRSQGYELEVVPFLDSQSHGVFATRAPRRPNPIGISVVRLERVENGILDVEGIDVLDGTPLIDIKPYVPDFDLHADVRTGWLAEVSKKARDKRSDDRFA
jgi:tRNA-Thr(GGU) m(6)t(6)A37 methyltransferase TsaA